jgi:hypothetical protein
MGIRSPRRSGVTLAVATAIATVALHATPAGAAAILAEWSFGTSISTCDDGRFQRICTFWFFPDDCREAAVHEIVLSCSVNVTISGEIIAVLNAAGQVVGCSSRGASLGGTVTYFGGVPVEIAVTATMDDTYDDAAPGLLMFSGTSSAEVGHWVAEGTFSAFCAAGTNTAWYGPAPGYIGWAPV